MLIIRAFALALLLASSFGSRTDVGCGIDPNGCSGRSLTTQAGGEMDPNGVNGGDYAGCVDPNGRCRG